eukprot:ANDGO_06605.mRNA.1 hypothetical protein
MDASLRIISTQSQKLESEREVLSLISDYLAPILHPHFMLSPVASLSTHNEASLFSSPSAPPMGSAVPHRCAQSVNRLRLDNDDEDVLAPHMHQPDSESAFYLLSLSRKIDDALRSANAVIEFFSGEESEDGDASSNNNIRNPSASAKKPVVVTSLRHCINLLRAQLQARSMLTMLDGALAMRKLVAADPQKCLQMNRGGRDAVADGFPASVSNCESPEAVVDDGVDRVDTLCEVLRATEPQWEAACRAAIEMVEGAIGLQKSGKPAVEPPVINRHMRAATIHFVHKTASAGMAGVGAGTGADVGYGAAIGIGMGMGIHNRWGSVESLNSSDSSDAVTEMSSVLGSGPKDHSAMETRAWEIFKTTKSYDSLASLYGVGNSSF